MKTKNIVFDEKGSMIAFVNDSVIRDCQNLGLAVEMDVGVDLVADFLNDTKFKIICKGVEMWTIGG